jgi:Excalibur calcium-binding domain
LKTRLLSVIVVAFAVTTGSSAPAFGVVTAAAQGDVTPTPTVVSVVGDRDGFGYGLTDGQYQNGGFFDYRQLGDPDFTDVYPAPATYSPRLAVYSYEHQFDVPDGMNSAAAYFDWLTLGIQDGDMQVAGGDTDIRLLLDGVEVPAAFDTVDQFDFLGEIAGSVSIDVPPALFPQFADGRVVVTLETHALGSYDGLDAYATDFSQLTLDYKYRNCKALNRKYPHGVGRIGARDRVRGRVKPVTNFRRSNVLYRLNKGLDRDADKVACEKH